MERSTADTKKEVPAAYHYLIKIQYKQHNMVLFYKIWKNCNEIQLTKIKRIRTIENEKLSTLPG